MVDSGMLLAPDLPHVPAVPAPPTVNFSRMGPAPCVGEFSNVSIDCSFCISIPVRYCSAVKDDKAGSYVKREQLLALCVKGLVVEFGELLYPHIRECIARTAILGP